MAKVDYRRLSPQRRQHHVDLLIQTLEKCGLNAEGSEFLCDVLVESEITMLARRISIAKLLLQGLSFEQIRAQLRVGLTTIIAVDSWLSAKMYAYRSIVGSRTERKKRRERNEMFDLLTLRELRRKYPGRHALINLMLGDHP